MMAAAQRKPLRIDDTVDAACVRVHAGMFAERVNVPTVTNVWPASAGRGASTTVVSFNLHDSSNRRERRQRRSEARAAAFRARRRFGVAIQDARAAGEEYARELVAFAGLSVEAPPFFLLSRAAYGGSAGCRVCSLSRTVPFSRHATRKAYERGVSRWHFARAFTGGGERCACVAAALASAPLRCPVPTRGRASAVVSSAALRHAVSARARSSAMVASAPLRYEVPARSHPSAVVASFARRR